MYILICAGTLTIEITHMAYMGVMFIRRVNLPRIGLCVRSNRTEWRAQHDGLIRRVVQHKWIGIGDQERRYGEDYRQEPNHGGRNYC